MWETIDKVRRTRDFRGDFMRFGVLSRLALAAGVWAAAAVNAEAAPGDLAKAALEADGAKVTRMLAAGADPNDRGAQEATALMFAAQNNDLAMVKALIAGGADPKAVRGGDVTALHHAAARANAEVLAALLEAGAELEAKSAAGATPLRTALASQNWPAAEFLMERGAKLSNAKDHQQALIWALPYAAVAPPASQTRGTAKVNVYTPPVLTRALMEKLIAEGADPAQAPGGIQTLLNGAASQLQYEAVAFLLEQGAKVDEPSWSGDTPLLLATNDSDIEQKLGGFGFMHTIIGGDGVMGNDARTTLRIMMQGDVTSSATNMLGLDNAKSRLATVTERRSATVKALLAGGADAKFVTPKGETAISRLSRTYDGASVALLMAAGADATLISGTRAVPLHSAAEFGHRETVEAMLKGGANANARNSKQETPLMSASMGGGDLVTVELLLAAGADVNAKDAQGMTALHRAAGGAESVMTRDSKQNIQIVGVVNTLLKAGADPLIKDKSGKTARDYAKGPKFGVGAATLKTAEDTARKRN